MKTALHLTVFAFVTLAAVTGGRAQDEEAKRHWLHERGGPFFISRDPVQADLALTEKQKKELDAKLVAAVRDAMETQKGSSGEREQAMRSLRQTSAQNLETFLQGMLTPAQSTRFTQLKRQYDTPSIMLQPEVGKELSITDDQRRSFIELVQEMQKSILPLMKEAKASGHPEVILPRVIALRQDCQAKIEGLLSEPQKAKWKEMTGKPLVIW